MKIDDIDVEDIDKELESIGKVKVKVGKQVGVIPGGKEGSGSKSVPKMMYNPGEFKRVMNSEKTLKKYNKIKAIQASHGKEYEVPDMTEYTGIKELDEVLSTFKKPLKLNRGNQLVKMFGCVRCWARGTKRCPFNIGNGEEHDGGYCTAMVQEQVFKYTCMRSSSGAKFIRDTNIMNLHEMLEHYSSRLRGLDRENLTKTEVVMMRLVKDLMKDYGEMMDKKIKQDDGSLVRVEREINTHDLDKLFRKAVKPVDIEVEDVVVEEEEDKDVR